MSVSTGVPTITVPATAGVNAAKTSKTPAMSNAFEPPEKCRRIVIGPQFRQDLCLKLLLPAVILETLRVYYAIVSVPNASSFGEFKV
jgi:hypothetical protein